MEATLSSEAAIRDLAETYCEGVHFARPEVFEAMCHDRFTMTEITEDGGENAWDKAAYLERVRARRAFPGEVSREILDIDVAGDQIARVHLWVDVPPRRYEDHLGFVRTGGQWKLLTKVFRTMGPSAQNG
ncbi:nuclear transport factor 2 family protein [Jannaschia ovalis]|uniref:Nuclear transport factor 2 family protein n=1 Tax=Jannaschia ovalis TaxID=3038773 RepID=A0ABY8LC69_9RHOB|nr:nuclear transport factor 2 family protein [Jannaschia sp. GRR-S6-38]WGH77645.1 nuclear transport factor 2 family protein [Jannaschia sp. GRR-S6-38]